MVLNNSKNRHSEKKCKKTVVFLIQKKRLFLKRLRTLRTQQLVLIQLIKNLIFGKMFKKFPYFHLQKCSKKTESIQGKLTKFSNSKK